MEQNKKKYTKVVGIRFADNDFRATINSFLQNLALVYQNPFSYFSYSEPDANSGLPEEFTKQKIVELFNALAPGLYLMHQNRFRYDSSLPKDYLAIKEDNVYFGNEVYSYITKHNYWDNGEFHYIDFAQKTIDSI